jgi:hypothetical protein
MPFGHCSTAALGFKMKDIVLNSVLEFHEYIQSQRRASVIYKEVSHTSNTNYFRSSAVSE